MKKATANKIFSVLIGIAMLSIAGFAVGFYNDKEQVPENKFEAGTLDFEISNFNDFATKLTPTQNSIASFDVVSTTSLPFKYWAKTSTTSGELCSSLNVNIKLNGNSVYNGLLSGFDYEVGIWSDPAQFEIEALPIYNNPALQDKTCNFDLELEAVQADHNHARGQGYRDIHRISFKVTAGHWIDNSFCELTDWNPGSLKVVVTNTYDSACRIENWKFVVECVPGKKVDCNAVGLSFSNGMGVNAMHQIDPPFPEGMTTMFDPASPFGGGQGVIWLTRPVPVTGKTYSVNVQHEVSGYESSYGAYITYGDTCSIDGTSKILRLNMPSYAHCANGIATTRLEFAEPKYIGKLFLNEFLPNPSGIDSSNTDWGYDNSFKPKGEWIEIYNNDDQNEYDLNNWIIRDRNGNQIFVTNLTTKTGSTVIGKKGSGNEWLVVYTNKQFLNNTGDDIKLYDPANNIIDKYSYGDPLYCTFGPTINGSNEEVAQGDCSSLSSIQGNKSYARIPDGTGAWIDPYPTPGTANIEEETIITPTSTPSVTPIEIPTSTASTTENILQSITAVPSVLNAGEPFTLTATVKSEATNTIAIIARIINTSGNGTILETLLPVGNNKFEKRISTAEGQVGNWKVLQLMIQRQDALPLIYNYGQEYTLDIVIEQGDMISISTGEIIQLPTSTSTTTPTTTPEIPTSTPGVVTTTPSTTPEITTTTIPVIIIPTTTPTTTPEIPTSTLPAPVVEPTTTPPIIIPIITPTTTSIIVVDPDPIPTPDPIIIVDPPVTQPIIITTITLPIDTRESLIASATTIDPQGLTVLTP